MDCDKCFVLHVSYDLDLLHPLQGGPLSEKAHGYVWD